MSDHDPTSATTTLDPTAVMAAVPVSDAAAAEAFYARVFGRPADEHPMPGLAQWVTAGGVVQLVADARRAGGGLATIVVADVTDATAGLTARGVETSTGDGTVVTGFARIDDPDGNAVTVVQA